MTYRQPWYDAMPDPSEITEAEVGAMLDDIDLDFDEGQKSTNFTNNIKSVNVTTTDKTIDHDIRSSE